MTSREVSAATRLRKAGLADPGLATRTIVAIEGILGDTTPGLGALVADDLARVADPDLAVAALLRVTEAARDVSGLEDLSALLAGPGRTRLVGVLGASTALGEFLARRPECLADLASPAPDRPPSSAPDGGGHRAALLAAVGVDPTASVPVATLAGPEGVNAMRAAYRRRLLTIAARDVAAPLPTAILPAIGIELADLASAALEAALALARAAEPDHAATRLAIIALGKCGARELNYISDVDVIYVAEPAEGIDDAKSLAVASRLAQGMARACDAPSTEPELWQVDANLRPEGKDGVLVRNLDAHRAYYERWAHTWEFQALLKARPAAGDAEVGAAYVAALAPMVWEASRRENFVEEAQAMRRRVERNVATAEADRQIKLGPGGLRDVEFTVQLLQLVHGRTDESLRVAPTLDALAALRDGGYVGRVEAARMDAAYRQLRVWEHRIQLHRMRRTHLMPDSPDGLRHLARSSGFATSEALLEAWHATRRDVRAMHLEMFYRPLLSVVARLSVEEVSLDPDAARQRLEAVGYHDPDAALRHLAALADGVSRRAAIQRQLLPAMIGWFADGADPDAGLLAFRSLSEQLRDAAWYLKLLRDSPVAAERLARLLSTSAYVTEALLASAEDVTWLDSDEDLAPRDLDRLSGEAEAIIRRSEDPDTCITALRGLRHRELARTAAADVLGRLDTVEAARTLTHVADVVLDGSLRVAMVEEARAAGMSALPFDMAIIAMGRYGGMEMSYPSDADVMFVYEPLADADRAEADRLAQRVATEVRRLLAAVGHHPPLETDADLRPDGKSGPLARSLDAYIEYYGRWSDPWEAQALLRARAAAGDRALAARFVAAIDAVRYPTTITPAALKQMRRLKARMESERLPQGIDPRRHVKLGPGGLSDVEWTIQLLQLQHAHEVEALRTPLTLAAIDAAASARILAPGDAVVLKEAWRMATRVRGALALRGHARAKTGVIPGDARELRALARILGEDWTGAELAERYSRAARHARSVMERVFFGWETKEEQ